MLKRYSVWNFHLGTDCGPNDVDTYPGRMPYNNDTYFDSNCNGISGIDEDGIPYEAKYCSGKVISNETLYFIR